MIPGVGMSYRYVHLHHFHQNKKGQPVSVSHNEAQNVWRVAYGFSAMYFNSYAKAMEYCSGRFFDLDGKQV